MKTISYFYSIYPVIAYLQWQYAPIKQQINELYFIFKAQTMTEREAISDIIDAHRHLEGSLLPILHAVQDRFGYLPPNSNRLIADALRVSEADVHGVISFYHYFRQRPPGKHAVSVCRAEACQAQGCRQLEAHIKTRLGIDFHDVTDDGQFSLEPVYCLGNCATGPTVRVNNTIYGRMSAEKVDRLFERLAVDTVRLLS